MCTAQLGEWIEFNTVVVRQHTATGTNPKRLVFDRLRRGLVVGMQFVHDSQADLEVRIANEISRLISAQERFTAYQVTLALRAADPGSNIVHAQVRAAVHQLMEPVIDSGLYESETAAFGRDSTIRYVPR